MAGTGRRRVLVQAALALGAMAVALAWLARQVDASQVVAAVESAQPAWLVAALVSVAGSMLLSVIRWRALFPPGQRPGLGVTGAVLVAGQALNILLPLRLGEVARVTEMTRRTGTPSALTLGTVAVERGLDLAAAGCALGVLLFLSVTPDWITGPAQVLVATGVLAALALAVLAATSRRWKIPDTRLGHYLGPMRDVLTVLAAPRTTAWIVLLTASIVAVAATTNYLVFLAFGLRLPAEAPLVLLLALQVGASVVSTPANLGVFHAIVVLVLGTWAVPRAEALACGIVLHAIALGPKLLAGPLVLLMPARPVETPPA